MNCGQTLSEYTSRRRTSRDRHEHYIYDYAWMYFGRVLIRLTCCSRIGIKFVDKNKTGLKEQKVGLRAAYLFAQSAKLSDQLATIAAVVTSLVRNCHSRSVVWRFLLNFVLRLVLL